jgi:hypothetical protein
MFFIHEKSSVLMNKKHIARNNERLDIMWNFCFILLEVSKYYVGQAIFVEKII